jgi:type III restriction enzyme
MALTLKTYQSNSLQCLQTYLQSCQSRSPALAFAQNLADQGASPAPAYNDRFGEAVPAVCLRVPTGGGKTLMAAHAVAIAGRAVLGTESPVALWLTPSDTIRTQTLEAFNDARHPYRQALTEHFGDRVRVCDLASLQTIGPHDVGHAAIVVVTTIQSLSVRRTSDRNVYSFFEALAPHFASLQGPKPEGLEVVKPEDLSRVAGQGVDRLPENVTRVA